MASLAGWMSVPGGWAVNGGGWSRTPGGSEIGRGSLGAPGVAGG